MTTTAPQPASGERLSTRDQALTRTPWGSGAPPMVQTKDARGTARRLLDLLRPERARITVMLTATVLSVSMTVYGPRLLGRATDLIVEGLLRADGLHGQPGRRASSMVSRRSAMSELKRNTDFAAGSQAATTAAPAAGIDESQPWRTSQMQQAVERWAVSAEAGFDPYNHVGTRVRKSRAA